MQSGNKLGLGSKSKSKLIKVLDKKLKVVADAKYYTSQLTQHTIDKTVDDL